MSFERRLFLPQQSSQAEDDTKALRWRTAILKLSANFMEAADERRDLSPVLIEALHNALENLLLLGDEADLLALEEWLDLEIAARESAKIQQLSVETTTDATPAAAMPSGEIPVPATQPACGQPNSGQPAERRFAERRFTERRVNSHFQIGASIREAATRDDLRNAELILEARKNQDDPSAPPISSAVEPANSTLVPAPEERRHADRRAADRRAADRRIDNS